MEWALYICLTLILILSVAIIVLIKMLRKSQKPSILDQLRLLLIQEREHNLKLMSLVLSKDPMTFSALLNQTNHSHWTTSEYVPSGTDEAEAHRWKEAANQYGVGEQVDYQPDLAEAGFTREENY